MILSSNSYVMFVCTTNCYHEAIRMMEYAHVNPYLYLDIMLAAASTAEHQGLIS